MIIVLNPEAENPVHTVKAVEAAAARFEGIEAKCYQFRGSFLHFTEVHLVGSTKSVPTDAFESIPGVLRVVRVSDRYRLIGRHDLANETVGFEYNGIHFDDRTLNIFAGLCAVDGRENVEAMLQCLQKEGIETTRMGVYKPRTSPYDFQGLGSECLPYVFELCGKYGIKVVAMEITDAKQIEEVGGALEKSGKPTGVMLQVGTRNAQNFELLKALGQQKYGPVLFKRGMGITLEESLNACEYIASEGNPNIIFCLRGVKSHLGDPHRNMVDVAHVPVVRRQTRLPVCIDPSHSVGKMYIAPDGLPDIFHIAGQGVIAGATMVLVDFHPAPEQALCDGPQALVPAQLPGLVQYLKEVRATYEKVTSASR